MSKKIAGEDGDGDAVVVGGVFIPIQIWPGYLRCCLRGYPQHRGYLPEEAFCAGFVVFCKRADAVTVGVDLVVIGGTVQEEAVGRLRYVVLDARSAAEDGLGIDLVRPA